MNAADGGGVAHVEPVSATMVATAPASSPRRRIAEIEVLRAFAVMMVLYEHLPLNLVWWHSRALFGLTAFLRGWVGVDLFFAISGFVIARGLLPILLQSSDIHEFVLRSVGFWLRRAWRLLPTAWVWLVVPLLLCSVWNESGALYDLRTNWAALISGVLDVANFRVGALFMQKPIGVAFPYWSLSLEEQFYLLLPVAVFVFGRWIALLLVGLVVLQFASGITSMGMMVRPGAISIGVLLALWEGSPSYERMAPRVLAESRLARVSAIGLLLLLLLAVGSDDLFIATCKVGLVALLSGALVWIASYGRGFVCGEGRTRRCLLWVAERSYAIYVIHIPVYLSFHEAWFRHDRWSSPHGWAAVLYVLAALAMTGALAWGSDRLYADRLRRYGAGVAERFVREPVVRPP